MAEEPRLVNIYPGPAGGHGWWISDHDLRPGHGIRVHRDPVPWSFIENALELWGIALADLGPWVSELWEPSSEHPNTRRDDTRQCIYFIRRESDGAVKIGLATSVGKRLAAIKTGAGPCKVLAVMPGHRHAEWHLHSQFAGERIHGEWFRYSPALRKLVEEHSWRVDQDGMPITPEWR